MFFFFLLQLEFFGSGLVLMLCLEISRQSSSISNFMHSSIKYLIILLLKWLSLLKVIGKANVCIEYLSTHFSRHTHKTKLFVPTMISKNSIGFFRIIYRNIYFMYTKNITKHNNNNNNKQNEEERKKRTTK